MKLSKEIKEFAETLKENYISEADFIGEVRESDVKDYVNDVLNKVKDLAILLEKVATSVEKLEN